MMDFYNNYYDNDIDYENRYEFNNSHRHNEKRNCCVKKVEETYLCCPSYYNENKYEDKKEELFYPCYEGTFTLCPRKSYCSNNEIKHDKCNKYNMKEENHDNRCLRNRCCFCRLFSRW